MLPLCSDGSGPELRYYETRTNERWAAGKPDPTSEEEHDDTQHIHRRAVGQGTAVPEAGRGRELQCLGAGTQGAPQFRKVPQGEVIHTATSVANTNKQVWHRGGWPDLF